MTDERIEELKPGKSPRETALNRIKEEKKKSKNEDLRKAIQEFLAADEVRTKALARVVEIEEAIREINQLSTDF